jgi:Family of unknown function (DUF6114)
VLPVTAARLASVAGRAWSGFGGWRRSRPFWGGLLLVLAGLEMYGTAHQDLSPIKVSFGPQVFMSWLIPGALLLCGLLTWFTPAQGAFYGILGALIAIAAVIGLNFGGFFVGLLLGLIGGALAVAWTPAPRPAAVEPAAAAPAAVAPPVSGESDAGPSTSRLLTALLLVAAVTAGLLMVPRTGSAWAAPCPTSPGTVAPTTGGAPAPSASPSSSPSGSPQPNPVIQFFDNLGRLIGIGGNNSSPSPSPSPTPTPAAKPAAKAAAAPAAAPNCGTTPTPKKSTSRSAGASPSPSASGILAPGPAKKAAVPAGQPTVNNRPSKQLSGTLTETLLFYDGVVDLTVAGGTLRALAFHLDTATSTPFELQIPVGSGSGYTIKSSELKVSGHVVLYATEIKGLAGGLLPGIPDFLPVDFTPDNQPPALPFLRIEFKDATVQLVFVHADTLTAANLNIGR